jgi:hypothetical protein
VSGVERLREALDLLAIDRLLAVEHREDDEPCSCDECMSYGAEDEGFDWYRIPAANRIAMRILDGGDERFSEIAKAFRDHGAALPAAEPVCSLGTGGGPCLVHLGDVHPAAEPGLDVHPDPLVFGDTVRRLRRIAGLTQRELADRVGADFTYMSKIENGHDQPGRALIERIDSAVGADGSLVEAWLGIRCPSCGHKLAARLTAGDTE